MEKQSLSLSAYRELSSDQLALTILCSVERCRPIGANIWYNIIMRKWSHIQIIIGSCRGITIILSANWQYWGIKNYSRLLWSNDTQINDDGHDKNEEKELKHCWNSIVLLCFTVQIDAQHSENTPHIRYISIFMYSKLCRQNIVWPSWINTWRDCWRDIMMQTDVMIW